MSDVLLGTNEFRGRKTPVGFKASDRLRHMYMIGKTGAGKSTVFTNMALQDIRNGSGVCFVDPHGEAIDWLLSRIPEERLEDVVLFDPSDTSFPVGLNLLEANTESERDFLVSELIEIFYKLFDPERTGIIGPQFEHWLRNAALTVMADPAGCSILEIPKLFVDRSFEQRKRKHLQDPLVQEFWSLQMARTADFHRSEMLNYFNSKFGQFLNNATCRNIIGQPVSGIRFDEVLSGQKILLVNLSKGKVGESTAHMLGLIIMAKLQVAVLRRANLPASERPPLYLYVDEFQNLTTDTFASMLSESRKYGLGVHLTNQYFSQLPVKIRSAVLGNAGTLLSFQLGAEDAEQLAREFHPFTKLDLMGLARYSCYIRLMSGGQSTEPFSLTSMAPMPAPEVNASEIIRACSRLAYSNPRLLVEAGIRERLKS
jgi:type IV secretory pathway TraG/TraD family ATPase VirD4